MNENILKLAGEDYEYIYDPKHENRPKGNWKQTSKGWVKGEKKKDDGGVSYSEHQSITFNEFGTGDANFALHKVQLTPDTVIYDDGYSKKYGDMSREEQEAVQKDVQMIGTFSQKGFSNYNDVSVETFHSNMEHQLDSIAAKNGIETRNTSQAKISKDSVQHFKDSLKENFENLKSKYQSAVRSEAAKEALENYENKLCEVVDECVKDGSLGDVTEEQLDSFLQEDMKRLIYQELETRRRSVGDHGIRHLVGNAVNTVDILEQLKQGGITKGTTGKDKLMGMICQVNHDIGYTVGTTATSGADGGFHKTHSGTIAAAERKRYADLLGPDDADMLVGKYECYEGTNLPKHTMESSNQSLFMEGMAKPIYKKAKDGQPKDDKGFLVDKDGNKVQDTDKNGKPLFKGVLKKEVVFNEDGTPKSNSEEFMRSNTNHTQKGAIQYHDDSDYDWQNNAFRSAVALADCTSLFGKDKVQEFFLEDNVAMENVVKMHTIMNAPDETFVSEADTKGKSKEEIKKIADDVREKLFEGFKKTMHKRIDLLACSLLDRDMLKSQVSEMVVGKFSTVSDILTRASGKLNGFKYNPQANTMEVNTQYSQEGKLLEDMFGCDVSRGQWDKMTKKDLGLKQSDIVDGNQKTTYGTEGKDRIVVNIAGMDDPKIQNPGVKAAYEKLAPRLIIQKLAILRKNGEIGGEEAKKKFSEQVADLDKQSESGKKSKGEEIFGTQWEQLKELLEKGEYAQLAAFPMTETERAYLMGAFKSAKIAKKVLQKLLFSSKIEKIAKRTIMGWINTFIYEEGENFATYRTNGIVNISITDKNSEKQVHYGIKINKDGQDGLDFFNGIIKKHKGELANNPEKFMKHFGNNWEKRLLL